MLIAIVVSLALGFGAGRVHHILSLEAKLVKLGETAKAEEVAGIAKVRSLLKFL